MIFAIYKVSKSKIIIIMAKSKFYEQIKSSMIEREVEDVYNKGINLYFPEIAITHPFACDGFIDTATETHKILKLIIEYKLDEMLKNKVARAKVLVQVLYYIKKFEQNGMVLPNVCMVGDKNECFVMHTNPLLQYLDEEIDWNIAPSNAHNFNPELVSKIAENEEINPFVFDIDDSFSFKNVAEKIVNLAENIKRYVRVTEHNISTIFDYFTKNVVKDAKKIAPNDLVAIFMGVITDKDNYYKHPTKKNTLVAMSKEIHIDGNGFDSFFSYFDRTYTPQEKNKFAEISDRLIEDTKRRNTGEFYTPTLFVDYAHDMLSKQFGEDWREKYVVWDNCCGTKNLTRDYNFHELYCSTLENAELEISERYNKEATSFQFDFLNDSLDKLPQGLKDAFAYNKPIIFLINPPYATACNWNETSKEFCADTMIKKEMHNDGLGCGAENLQHQFLYRICKIKEQYNLTDVHIGIFSKPIYLSGGKQAKFLNYLCNNFNFDNGVLFNASHFSDVSDKWGITFNVWSCGKTEDNYNFNHNLIDNINGEIDVIGTKNIYNINGEKSASDWIKEDIKSIKTQDAPQLSSALVCKQNGRGKLIPNALGYYVNVANNVCSNAQNVYFVSSCSSMANGISVMPQNFGRVVSNFAARKLIVGTWINDKDEYLAPNTEHSKWNEFENDSIVYSLFHSASNQSSLRGVEYKGKKWDIKNEFFFMGKEDILALCNEDGFDSTYNDCKNSNERYVYGLLQGIELSSEAQAVLDMAKELTIKSFKYRKMFNEEHPEYQAMNWDCGWYQIKAVVKEYMPNEYKEFDKLYKALAEKMRPMVYELGFLK